MKKIQLLLLSIFVLSNFAKSQPTLIFDLPSKVVSDHVTIDCPTNSTYNTFVNSTTVSLTNINNKITEQSAVISGVSNQGSSNQVDIATLKSDVAALKSALSLKQPKIVVTSTYTITAADNNTQIAFQNKCTVYIQSQATLPINVRLYRLGSPVTISPAAGVNVNSTNNYKTIQQWADITYLTSNLVELVGTITKP